MKLGNIAIPNDLINTLRDRKLVVFAGAGVSMGPPANLPSFSELTIQIASGTGEERVPNEPEDRFLGRLQHKGVKVHERAAHALSYEGLEPTELHRDLLKLFPNVEQARIVTTNFDDLFEKAAEGIFQHDFDLFRAPALPLGRDFNGIVHIHGAVSRPGNMVLTDSDFGRAYLTEGWARRFLIEMFRHYSVLFIGYSHNDLILSYLARALPEREIARRFTLIDDKDDLRRWQVLGIEPITYPKESESDYSSLNEGVKRLSGLVTRSILDWKRELQGLAGKPPPISEEEASLIDHALTEIGTTRLFTDYARHSAWLNWLDGRHALDPLFVSGTLNESQLLLAGWLATHYAVPCAPDMMLLVGKHGMHTHPELWCLLCSEIAFGEHEALDEPLLSKWVSVLLTTAPQRPDERVLFSLLELAKRCTKQGAVRSLFQIFEAMSRGFYEVKRVFTLREDDDGGPLRLDVEIQLIADHYCLHKIWQEGLKPNLVQLVLPLMSLVVSRLEEQHFTLRMWGRADRQWDRVSFRRSAIELHEQDKYPHDVDVLIDVARDCLDWIMSSHPTMGAAWCEQLIESEVPLLRRLAVHTTGKRTDMPGDSKLGWLIEKCELSDHPVHHELYIAAKLAYQAASAEYRSKFVDSVLALKWPKEEEREARTAWIHFNWLSWLHEAAPDCEHAKKALDDVLARFPDLVPRKFPDLTHWMGSGWVGPRSPWTVDELLFKPATEWVPELLEFQGDGFLGPDRLGLGDAVSEAAKKNIQWGFDLAAAMDEQKKWDSDLWPNLFNAWAGRDMDETTFSKFLLWIRNPELQIEHPRSVAELLHFSVRDGGISRIRSYLTELNEIASAFWRRLDKTESSDRSDDWLQSAISHPAGILAQFWLGSLALWRKDQDSQIKAFSEQYSQILTAIAEDGSLSGRLGRSILASQLPFLMSADENWTRTYILPLFSTDDDAEFQAAWDGFLTWGHLTLLVAETLEGAFLNGVARFKGGLLKRRDRFMEFYTALTGYSLDPLNRWIPALFRVADLEANRLFASYIGQNLRGFDEQQERDWWQRWLKAYWENRIQGVPVKLDAVEIEVMLDWLPSLHVIFPEAVDIAIRMPQYPLERSMVVYSLKRSELVEKYPEAVVHLLTYLSGTGSKPHVFYGIREVIDRLQKLCLPEVLATELERLRTFHG